MTQPVIEPNFEGEEMKIPEGVVETEAPVVPSKSILNTTLIVLLTAVLIAIFAGLGYWYTLVMNTPLTDTTIEEPTTPETVQDETPSEETTNTKNNNLSNSDEIEAIEADINNTELEELDRELDQIDAELEAELGAQ